jgi:hypothetical protein
MADAGQHLEPIGGGVAALVGAAGKYPAAASAET